jgi:tetratricopeptide (TPR) repeat protein
MQPLTLVSLLALSLGAAQAAPPTHAAAPPQTAQPARAAQPAQVQPAQVQPAQVQLDLGELGAVRVHQRCTPAARPLLERGVALLHSFFYEEARIAFQAAGQADPACATAAWGEAMTHYHPLWAPPTPEEAAAGTQAADRAAKLGGKGPVEAGLVDAIHAYWHARLPADARAGGEGTPSCHGGAPTPGGRAQAFRASLEALHARFPGDVEVTAFYALSLLGTAPKEDRTLAQQRRAAALLERAWARQPKHPGVVHYLIHAYDFPEVARRGLKAANAYTSLAPRVPHALHMPSHIYVRLGMWDENARANRRSLEAAERWMEVRHPGAINFDSFHAYDYLGYGFLQQGRWEEARAAVQEVTARREVYPARQFQAVYARAVLPARWALERDAWAEAARLRVEGEPLAGWADFPFAEGLVAYARGLGAARSGDAAGAREAAAALEAAAKATPAGPYAYFGKLLGAHRLAVLGWVAHLEGRDAEARRLLTEAADQEDAMGPHPVSPGPLLPARELLGDLHAELGEPEAARAAYALTLTRYPGRLRSLGGAMRASSADAALRQRYARQVLALARGGQAPVVVEAARAVAPGKGR